MITTVNTADALIAALRSAHAGDTVLLAAGAYNGVALSNLNFSSAVTIQSADPSHQAIINNLTVGGSSGLAFNQLHFGTSASAGTAVTVASSSHDISFSNDVFQGVATGSGNAMMIRDSSNVTVTGSDISKFWSGINELNANSVTVTNNTFHDLTSQGIRGTGVTNETISGNTFADAKASVANHTDAVYLWQDNVANHVTLGANTYGTTTGAAPTTGSAPIAGSTTTTGSTPITGSTGDSHAAVTVSTTAELVNAVQHAHAGDTILVAAGAYNGVALSNVNFSSTVTIQSADAAHQAVINNLSVGGSSGLAFNQLHFGTSTDTAVTVASSSHDIAFSNDVFQGAAAGSGNAMMIRDSSNITVTGSDIGKFWSGINELNAHGLTVTNNTFHDLTSQGVRGTGVTNETISGNTFAGANASVANHTDAVYLWQDNTANHVTLGVNTYGGTTTGSAVSIGSTTATAPPTTGSSASTATSPTTGATTYTVGNGSDLQNALAHAHGGDTILLKAGTYDGVAISNHNYDGTVTIASADPAHEAMINNLVVGNSSNLAFKNLDVEITGTSNYGVNVGNSSHISLDGLTITGASGSNNGVGVWMRNANDITVTNSDISSVGSGIGYMNDSGVTISNNTLHNLGTDGIFGSGTQHLVVTGNNISEFHVPTGAHPDAIQFWGGDADVLVANNVITRGAGDAMQGIFVEDTSDITITGNAMAGTMTNGISLARASNAMISNNFLDGYTDLGTRIIVRGASSDVTVVHNTTQEVQNYTADGVNPNYVASDNASVAPTAVGDLSAMKAWLTQHAGVTTALVGGLGGDVLTGTTGADTMSGGFGDDIYLVNHPGDVVNEAVNAGIDTVHSSIASYTLGANVENLVLTGSAAQTGIGNSLDNVLTSNGVQASLNGGAGNDTLIATGNADTLSGGAGSDVFSIGKVPTTAVQITDFTSGQDKLDLHTLLANYHGTDPVADNWVQFQSSSTGVSVLVDVDGPSGSAGFVTVAKLAGVTSLASSDWVFH